MVATQYSFTSPSYFVQRSFEFTKNNGEKAKEDVTVNVKENYVQYHVKENKADELWVVKDYNRVRTSLEAIQRRALRIIYSYTNDMPYINALHCASIPSLVDRREQLSRKFFTSLLQPSSCLHILLPTPRDPTITTRLRSANKFPRLPSRTRKYQTFISYGLAHYQTS